MTFTLPKKDWDKLEAYPEIRNKVLTLRLIKVLLPTGETEILCTLPYWIKNPIRKKSLVPYMTAVYSHPIEQGVREEYKADEIRKHPQKINRTNALAAMKKIVTKALDFFDELVYKTREIIKPNRSNPRNHRQKKTFSMNYKPL